MRIAPCCVHDEYTRIVAHGFGECLRTVFDDDVTPAFLAGYRAVEGRSVLRIFQVLEGGNDDVVFKTRFALNTRRESRFAFQGHL